ncbi:MAG: ABC transporter permease [Actinomycetaceae bacterium]|nr:ABC transporter permease [Actinomycetaceae bacterium]
MRAVFIKEFRELARDHRTLAMLVVLPIILLTVFGYAANFSVDNIKVGVIGSEAKSVANELVELNSSATGLTISTDKSSDDIDTATKLLRDREYDAVLIATDPTDGLLAQRIHIYVDGSRLFTAMSAQRTFMEIMAEDVQNHVDELSNQADEARANRAQVESDIARFTNEMSEFRLQMQQALAARTPLPEIPTPPQTPSVSEFPEIDTATLTPDSLITILYNPDLKTSWVMIPGLIGLILTFIGVLITSIGLVRERETGTLEQLAIMPLRPSMIILGKTAPYFLLAIIDMAIVSVIGIWLFGVPFRGNVWLFMIASIIFLFVVLGLGVLISTVSQTTGQAIQMAVMFVMPQILLSGLIFPLHSMAVGIRWIGYILPLTWFLEIAQGIMLRDATVATLWLPLAILAFQAVLVFGVATGRMRYALTHGGAR